MDLREYVRDIPDFPHDGIMFRDITALLAHPGALDQAVDRLAAACAALEPIDYVVAAEARGFILGAALARQLHAGFVPARKPGKLPAETVSAEYALEYGLDALEVHADAFAHGARVLVHDDLLATGGTAGPPGGAGARSRRSAGHRRHGGRAVRARDRAGRADRRLRVPDRAVGAQRSAAL